MLFQWSSEGTQYALLENMSCGMFASISNCPFDIHMSILRTLCLKPCTHLNCIIVVFNPHQQYFGDVVSKYGFLPDMKSTFGNRSKEKWETLGVKCRNVMSLYESKTTCIFINAIPVPYDYHCSHLDILLRPSFPTPTSD